jgi:hypothetical protein
LGFLTTLIPNDYFNSTVQVVSHTVKHYNSIGELLIGSFVDGAVLSLKIVLLITSIIFVMDFIKSLSFIKNSKRNIDRNFSIFVGYILGITYGASTLIKEAKSSNLSRGDLYFIATFLLIAHAIIEDTLLFVIFGADFTVIITIRTLFAIIMATVVTKFLPKI